MDEIEKRGLIDLNNAKEKDIFLDINGKKLMYLGQGKYRSLSNELKECYLFEDDEFVRYGYSRFGQVLSDIKTYPKGYYNLKENINDTKNEVVNTYPLSIKEHERVEIRLKIALRLVDDVDNRNTRERLKKQIDKIEAAIMDFD